MTNPSSAVTDTSPLTRRVRELLGVALTAYAATPEEARLRAALERLDQPLRVSLAGRLKAGKSTLLNALAGERLAATDATECTRVVTWYSNGVASRAWAHPRDGSAPRQLRFVREQGRTVMDLGELRVEDLDRLTVEIPSRRLERLTLIDTPGLGSLSTEVSGRTDAFLAGDERGADAVLYLMRHLHVSDVGFLEAFSDRQVAGSMPVNAVGVLSRADELGTGRGDALELAGRIAADYRRDARVRALVQTVVPVAGLLAQAGATLREVDYAALAAIAAEPATLLLSTDRFQAESSAVTVPATMRRELLAGLGIFGVRLAVALIRLGLAPDAGALARELRRRSGLEELRRVLLTQFTERRDVLKAQHALQVLELVMAARSVVGVEERLRSQLEAVVVGAHELTELRLLNDLRTAAVVLADPDLLDEAEALLGADGTAVRTRLRLPADTPEADLRPALVAVLRRWRRLGDSPVADPSTRRTAAVLRRTCEGLLASTGPAGCPE